MLYIVFGLLSCILDPERVIDSILRLKSLLSNSLFKAFAKSYASHREVLSELSLHALALERSGHSEANPLLGRGHREMLNLCLKYMADDTLEPKDLAPVRLYFCCVIDFACVFLTVFVPLYDVFLRVHGSRIDFYRYLGQALK